MPNHVYGPSNQPLFSPTAIRPSSKVYLPPSLSGAQGGAGEVIWSVGGPVASAPLNTPSQRWYAPFPLTIVYIAMTLGTAGSGATRINLFNNPTVSPSEFAVIADVYLPGGMFGFSSPPAIPVAESTMLYVTLVSTTAGADNLAVIVRYVPT